MDYWASVARRGGGIDSQLPADYAVTLTITRNGALAEAAPSEHKAYASAIDYWQWMFAQHGRRRTRRACCPMASRKRVTRL